MGWIASLIAPPPLLRPLFTSPSQGSDPTFSDVSDHRRASGSPPCPTRRVVGLGVGWRAKVSGHRRVASVGQIRVRSRRKFACRRENSLPSRSIPARVNRRSTSPPPATLAGTKKWKTAYITALSVIAYSDPQERINQSTLIIVTYSSLQ
jgi:hypothetical protein